MRTHCGAREVDEAGLEALLSRRANLITSLRARYKFS